MQVSREGHLKIAKVLWRIVGIGLNTAGLIFLFGNAWTNLFPAGSSGMAFFSLLIGLFLGWLKGTKVLTRVAAKNKARIQTLPEQSPFYMTYSAKSWVMVLGMILLGRLIRFLGASHLLVGAIYIAVGVALIIGSEVYIEKDTVTPSSETSPT